MKQLVPSMADGGKAIFSMHGSTMTRMRLIMTIFPIARCPGQWKLNGAIRFALFVGNEDRLRASARYIAAALR